MVSLDEAAEVLNRFQFNMSCLQRFTNLRELWVIGKIYQYYELIFERDAELKSPLQVEKLHFHLNIRIFRGYRSFVGMMPQLKHLHIKYSPKLPTWQDVDKMVTVMSSDKLETLTFSNIQEMPSDFGKSEWKLTTVFANEKGSHLRYLDLSHNGISSIGNNIHQALPNLQFLDLSYNNFLHLAVSMLYELSFHPTLVTLAVNFQNLGKYATNSCTKSTETMGAQGTGASLSQRFVERPTTVSWRESFFYEYGVRERRDCFQHTVNDILSNHTLFVGFVRCLVKAPVFTQSYDVLANASCGYGFQMPIFPAMKHFFLNNVASSEFFDYGEYFSMRPLCFHENTLEMLDLSYLYPVRTFDIRSSIRGLNNVRELKMSGQVWHYQLLTLQSFHWLPDLEVLDISYGNIPVNDSDEICRYVPNLRRLNMAAMNVTHLPEHFFRNCEHLEYIDISNNALKFLKRQTRNDLDRLHSKHELQFDIHGNPLTCSCHSRSVRFIDWLKSSKVNFINLEKTTCRPKDDSKHIFNIKEMILGEYKDSCEILSEIVLSAIACVVTALCCVGVNALHKYRHRVITRLCRLYISFRQLFCHQLTSNRRKPFRFHIYVSFSLEDSVWVDSHLLPVLEQRNGFICCITHRDFPGENYSVRDVISENITNSVVVLVIMSRASLKAHQVYLAFERRLARWLEITDNKKIIYVQLENLDSADVPSDVASVLSAQIHHTWPDDDAQRALFFDKLTSLIYRKLMKMFSNVKYHDDDITDVADDLVVEQPDGTPLLDETRV